MLYIDSMYASQIANRMRNSSKKDTYLWNFSCPICGDSHNDKLKARGYIYRIGHEDGLLYKCHNCGASYSFGNFLKQVDENMYKEYVFESMQANNTFKPQKKEKIVLPSPVKIDESFLSEEKTHDKNLDYLIRADKLDKDSFAYQYLLERKIPLDKMYLFYYTDTFKKYSNIVLNHDKFKDVKHDHPRIIIPYFNTHGKMIAFQGRALHGEEPKYFTIKVDPDAERVYGLERVNWSEHVYVTEGPIDSLFLRNGIAVSGSSFQTETVKKILTNATIVMDNEPRAKEIVKLLEKNIKLGYNVCMIPEYVEEKDINEMIKNGYSTDKIMKLIDDNTFSGIAALARFGTWKRI